MSRIGQRARSLIELLRQHGVYGLAGADGCRCTYFSVQGFEIDIRCHKSSCGVSWHSWGVIRVVADGEDCSMGDRRAVADELLAQLTEPSWEDEYKEHYWLVRFCRSKHDHKQVCIYCEKPRADEQGYLCDKCLVSASAWGPQYMIADDYDFRRIEQSSMVSKAK